MLVFRGVVITHVSRENYPSLKLTAGLHLKNDGKGRRPGFLLGPDIFSGTFAVKLHGLYKSGFFCNFSQRAYNL